MSIPDILKRAYEENDWSLVSQAHQMLTGENLTDENIVSEDSDSEISFKDVDTPPQKYEKFKMRDRDEPIKGDGGRIAKREPMQIPSEGNRELGWTDEGTIAKEDSVKNNPHLGTTPKRVFEKRDK